MVGRVLKQAIIGTTLFGVLAALTGCTYLMPPEPTPLVETSPPKVVRRVPVEQKIVRRPPVEQKVVKAAPKRVVKKKVIEPVEEESAPPVIAPLGGSGGGGGGGW
ncbi:hypothetical protein [Mesorhizobium helmanticense]|uniref:Uncharacterized protein n=1 Tax=Mesorhizobium helmanticense TaxID=1776423 RepID=A0A2T4IZ88_9HYPH|nr:hypothetical protein [Mesorhizobium helmanticense]PTE10893.1 hypothetical protein C9427_08070 [Mesorhizobium helmanticense]